MDSVHEKSEHSATQYEEISLIDAIQFFRDNWKFIGLTTVALSAIAITISLLQPKPPAQYQKQLTLSLKPNSPPLSNFPAIDVNQTNASAIKFLETPKLDLTITAPEYDPTTQQISLTLESLEERTLTSSGTKVANQLEKRFEKVLERTLETNLKSLDIHLRRNEHILAKLEQQIAQTPVNPSSTQPNPRLSALEGQRTNYVTNINALEFDKQYLEQAQENLAEFTSQVISVQIVSESEVKQIASNSSPLPIAIISVIASFMVAIFSALIREQIPRLRQELEEKKPLE